MQKFTKLFSVLAILCTILLFSCKKDDSPSEGGSRKVVYKAFGSAGTDLNVAVVSTDGAGGTESFSSLSGENWESKEYTFPNSTGLAVASVSAVGNSANSTLRIEIWVDGEKKAEGNSTGEILSANANFSLR